MIFLFHVLCFFILSCIYHFFSLSGGYRYLRPLVADVAVVAKCHLSALYRHAKGKLFAQLVDLLQFYEKFEINDHAGTQLTDDEVLQYNYDRFLSFQLLAFNKIPKVCF
jgi:intron-binding protein aquarius